MRQSPASPKTNPEARRLLNQVRDKIRLKHYSIRTEQAYTDWIRRFILYHEKRHPAEMGAVEVEQFLTHLAVAGKVFASTQNQAKSALLFLHRDVLAVELPWLDGVAQAKNGKRLPVVLTVQETLRLLNKKDIDFERHELIVCEGKGNKDRVTMLQQSLAGPLQQHLVRVPALHVKELAEGLGDVYLPFALARKYPAAGREWHWAAPAHPCARGIGASMHGTICVSRGQALDRYAQRD